MDDIDTHGELDMNDDLLDFARAWKAGYTLRVHPTVARRLNQALVASGDDPVPLARATSEASPTLATLLHEAHRIRPPIEAVA